MKNAIRGDLIRTLLIQVQKTKVDVDLAMAALDKLLKSNELNFAFLGKLEVEFTGLSVIIFLLLINAYSCGPFNDSYVGFGSLGKDNLGQEDWRACW